MCAILEYSGGEITTSSCKAKGRRLQQLVCAGLLEIGKDYGLEPDDIQSRGMGQNGVDCILSPAARRIFSLSIECKNTETLNVPKTFWDHYKKYEKDGSLKLLIHAKNRHTPLVSMRMEDFFGLLRKTLDTKRTTED